MYEPKAFSFAINIWMSEREENYEHFPRNVFYTKQREPVSLMFGGFSHLDRRITFPGVGKHGMTFLPLPCIVSHGRNFRRRHFRNQKNPTAEENKDLWITPFLHLLVLQQPQIFLSGKQIKGHRQTSPTYREIWPLSLSKKLHLSLALLLKTTYKRNPTRVSLSRSHLRKISLVFSLCH